MTSLATNALWPRERGGRTVLNGKELRVEWTAAAERALAARSAPLILELELHFSCLVKKTVSVVEDAGAKPLAWVNDRLAVYFQPVTSVGCALPEGEARRSASPKRVIETAAVGRIAPKKLHIDFRESAWRGMYWM